MTRKQVHARTTVEILDKFVPNTGKMGSIETFPSSSTSFQLAGGGEATHSWRSKMPGFHFREGQGRVRIVLCENIIHRFKAIMEKEQTSKSSKHYICKEHCFQCVKDVTYRKVK